MTKKKTYFEFWLAKGEYGKIRIARMLQRKQARYEKRTNRGHGSCNHSFGPWHSCPFHEEMNGDYNQRHCRCCSECTHDCAMDI